MSDPVSSREVEDVLSSIKRLVSIHSREPKRENDEAPSALPGKDFSAEEILSETTAPYYNGEVDYGDRAEHCWNGDPEQPNAISRLRYNTMYVPKILDRIKESAPAGADLTSWRY